MEAISRTPILEQVLERAKKSPFYKSKIKNVAVEDWETISPTTKYDLRNAYPFGMLACSKSSLFSIHESSGTTGQPTSSFLTQNDWNDIVLRFTRNSLQLNSSDSLLIKTPYSMVTTAHQAQKAAETVGATIIPADNRTSNMSYERLIRVLKDYQATVAWCLPTEALIWARCAESLGLDPKTDFAHLRAFLVAGEPLSKAKRNRIERLWGGKQVYQDYGSTETGSLAGECPQGHLHLWSDRLLFEVMNPQTKEVSTFGQGALLVTPLYREAMPLIRYEIGDYVEIEPSSGNCGWDFPTLKVKGRQGDLQSQLLVHIEDSIYSLDDKHNISFWRAKLEADSLHIEVEKSARGNDSYICSHVHETLSPKFSGSIHIRSLESNYFFDSRNISDRGFRKPKFLFGKDENWDQGLKYLQC